MRLVHFLFTALVLAAPATAQQPPLARAKIIVKRDIPYAEPSLPRQVLDIYAPAGAKKLPVVF